MEKLRSVFTKIFMVALLVSGIGIVLSSIPIAFKIVDLAINGQMYHAFLFVLLLAFIWIIGFCVFLVGILITSYFIEDTNIEINIKKDKNNGDEL